MLERFKALLRTLGKSEGRHDAPLDETAIAAVALALSVIRADGLIDISEDKALEAMMRAHFGLDHPGFDALLTAARLAETDATDHYRFATHLRRNLDEEARTDFIDTLWKLVDADGKHNEIEDHLVWRIAEMIGVSGRNRNAGGPGGQDGPGGLQT